MNPTILAQSLKLFILFVLFFGTSLSLRKYRYFPRRYFLTLTVSNHNVTGASFFRLYGVGNTADFIVKPGRTFTKQYEVRRKGYWTLVVEFPGHRYSTSPPKIISRDSYNHWMMEVYYYARDQGMVGFSDWHRAHGILKNDYSWGPRKMCERIWSFNNNLNSPRHRIFQNPTQSSCCHIEINCFCAELTSIGRDNVSCPNYVKRKFPSFTSNVICILFIIPRFWKKNCRFIHTFHWITSLKFLSLAPNQEI